MRVNCPKCSKQFADEELLDMHLNAQHMPSELELDRLAREALLQFLKSDGTDRGLLAKAKQANTYRSTEARREQTQGAREATLVMMARELAEDKVQFRELVRLALPRSPMLRLPAAKPDNKTN